MLVYKEWYLCSHQSDRRIRVCITHQLERRICRRIAQAAQALAVR